MITFASGMNHHKSITMKKKTITPPVAQVSINEKLGNFFVDIAKLVFAGVVLSSLLNMNINKIFVLLAGLSTTVIFVIVGFKFYKFRRD